MYLLDSIHVYPIKSLGGISLSEAVVQPRGLQYDRRWMLVDEQGRFVSQREAPGLALLGTAIDPPYLVVFSKKKPAQRVHIPLEPAAGAYPETMVQIWNDHCQAQVLDADIHGWFSDAVQRPLRLVYMPDTTRRTVDPHHAPKGQYVGFADAYPFLLIGQASLDELNRRMAQPLPMNHFRPNFVVTGGAPFEEDGWRDIAIGTVKFRCIKLCVRCILPTTDQETGERGAEPLKTLASFRQRENKILFGQNVVWLEEGEATVRVGDCLRSK